MTQPRPLPNPNELNSTENLFMNPIVRQLKKIKETDGTHATYSGVIKKTIYFLCTIFAGAIIAMILHTIPYSGITDTNGIFLSYIEIGALIASCAIAIICPFLAVLLRKTTAVTGTLSCVGSGCLLGLIGMFIPQYRGAMLLAFILTFALVAVLLFIYSSKKNNITKKFKVVVSALFGTIFLSSILLGLCYFIPGCKDIFTYIKDNTLLSILFSIGGLVIASLFLLMDFDAVHYSIENKLPKKYEWLASYSLAFTVLWIYFKIFDLIVSAQKNNQK